MEIDQVRRKFAGMYGPGEARAFIGPARINLIGEHTDHQGGYVFPCAIGLRSLCMVRPRTDGKIRLAATDLPGIVEADISDLSCYGRIPCGSYQLGVLHIMQKRGYTLSGMDLLYDETVPYGSGLSSSAAIEVATAFAVAALHNDRTGTPIDPVELALIAQTAENDYVGMNCGIMDQFASAMGIKDHAILLRCHDLKYEYVPVRLKENGYTLLICNTKKPRSLITSAYNQRRAECEDAFSCVKDASGIRFLAEMTPDQFEEYKCLITDPTALRRARHVIYENARTIEACEKLRRSDVQGFGELVTASHVSIRDLFEVTGPELDAMFEASIRHDGVIGTRMTGAGFGGCSIAIVKDANVPAFIENVGKEYSQKTGLHPGFYVAEIEDGAREIK